MSPDLLATMDAEHDTMGQALVATRAAMAHLVRTPGREQVYLDNVDHPAIVEMAKAFAKVSPARGGRFFAWLLDGATPDQRAALGNAVPGPVLKIITGIFGRGYRKNVAPVWSR